MFGEKVTCNSACRPLLGLHMCVLRLSVCVCVFVWVCVCVIAGGVGDSGSPWRANITMGGISF